MLEALHVFANHKVTGPAELALESARAVAKTGRVRARFISSRVSKTRYRDRWLQLLATERGIEEPRDLDLRLAKHFWPFSAFRDARRLARFLDVARPQVVHAHLPNDHLIAAWAATRSSARPAIVRTIYDGEAPRPSWRTRRTLGSAAAVICLSRAVAEELKANPTPYALDAARIHALDPPIDTTRFDPARARGEKTRARKREELGVPQGAFCLGIVARMQTHRRFEVLLEAMKRAKEKTPDVRLVIVGRGTNQDTVAREPVKALGLEENVKFAGYQSGEDYVATLDAIDAKVFLVPGSDGSCRAVREALSMGRPVIATRRGMLPELVRDGTTGILVDEDPASLARAIDELATNSERRAALAKSAREDALARFSFDQFGNALADVYERVATAPVS